MTSSIDAEETPTSVAVLVGLGVGAGVLGLYLVLGLTFAQWSLAEFFGQLTPQTVLWLVAATAVAIAGFGGPVAAYLRFRLLAPLVVLALVLVVWLTIGVTRGLLDTDAVFGLGVYAIGLTPIYLLLYLLFGGVEYYSRGRATR